jgi:hypothetical protein
VNEIAARDVRSATLTPSPCTDRSALSEAWYRALYGSSSNAMHAPNPKAHEGVASKPSSEPATSQVADARATTEAHVRNATPSVVSERRPFAASAAYRVRPEQKAPTAPAQRAWRQAVARRLALRVELRDGSRLDLLVQQRGRRVHVLALARGARTAPATAVLNRARAALALHGIRVQIEPA